MESILTRPQDQLAVLQGRAFRTVTVPPGGAARITPNDPARLAFIVIPSNKAAGFTLFPFHPQGLTPTVSPYTGQTPILIHGSMYPFITQQDWWAYSDIGLDLYVSEISTKEQAKPDVP